MCRQRTRRGARGRHRHRGRQGQGPPVHQGPGGAGGRGGRDGRRPARRGPQARSRRASRPGWRPPTPTPSRSPPTTAADLLAFQGDANQAAERRAAVADVAGGRIARGAMLRRSPEEEPEMRWSHAYIPTLRDDPADAEAVSHRLLVRGGFIRQLMAGSVLAAAARQAGCRQGHRDHPRGDRGHRRSSSSSCRWSIPAEVWKQHRPVGRRGRGAPAVQGPAGCRPGAGDDPRGDLHAAWPAELALLPRPPAALVPLPDQVPRRAARQGRACCGYGSS